MVAIVLHTTLLDCITTSTCASFSGKSDHHLPTFIAEPENSSLQSRQGRSAGGFMDTSFEVSFWHLQTQISESLCSSYSALKKYY